MANTSAEQIDTIAPFPYSSNIGYESGILTPFLSILSQIAMEAALDAHSQHPNATLLLAGETGYPSEFPDTADLMSRYAQTHNPDINESQIVTLNQLADGTYLNNTHQQATALAEYAVAHPNSSMLVLALDFHLPRVRNAGNTNRLPATYVSAESLLRRSGKLDQYLPQLECVANELTPSERMLARLSQFDRKGRLLNLLTDTRGARMVDVVRDAHGTFRLISTTTRRHLHQVRQNAPHPIADYGQAAA